MTPELLQLLEALEEWARKQADISRSDGWAAHNRKESIKEAIYIGREFAFMLMVYRVQEILKGQIEALDELVHSVTDPRD